MTSSASKSVSVLHASLRVAAGQARQAGDEVKAAALDGEAQAIEDALLDAVREGLELLEAMACYVRTGHHSKDTGEWRDGKGLVATSWLHTISRDGDPQLHVHLAVLNAVQRADGADDQWRAADGQHLYQLRHLYGVTVDRAYEQRLLDMGYAMVDRADGNGAEIGGVSQQVMDQFSSRAQAIDGRLRTWVDQYTAKHGKPPSRRTIYLMGQEIAKDTRRPKAEAKRMAGGKVTGHEVTDEERLKAWEDQTTTDELQVLSAVHAEAKAYASRSTRRLGLADADKARAARIAVAEAQRQRSAWGISDLCLEIHRALPVGATPADITEVAMLAISGTVGAEVVQVGPAPDLMDVSSLGIRESDGQSIFRKPNTMRWSALSHLNLEEQVIGQARRPIRPLVTEQQVRAELDRHHQDLDARTAPGRHQPAHRGPGHGPADRPRRGRQDQDHRRGRQGVARPHRRQADRLDPQRERRPGHDDRRPARGLQHRPVPRQMPRLGPAPASRPGRPGRQARHRQGRPGRHRRPGPDPAGRRPGRGPGRR